MPELTIGDKTVTVGDEFLKLSPADQNAAVSHIAQQIGVGGPAAPAAPETAPVSDDVRFQPGANTSAKMLEGIPVLGAYVPQAGAAISAAAHPLTGVGSDGASFGERYSKNLEQERAASETIDKQQPISSAVAKGVGGAIAMAPIMAAAPAAFGLTGETVAARIAAGAASGAGVGGVDAAARGENPAIGAGIGAVAGGALPAVARGVGAIVGAVKSSAPEIAGSASSKVARALKADGLDAATVEARLAEIGPDATLADLGPNLRSQAEAIAASPGPGQKAVLDAMTTRAEGAGGRIAGALDEHLGPAVNPTELTEQIISRRKAAAAPLYQDAYATPISATPEINAVLDTPFGKLALQKAGTLAKSETGVPLGMFGPKPAGPVGAKMTAAEFQQYLKSGAPAERPVDVRGLDLVKRALDDMHDQATRTGANNRARVIDGLRKQLLTSVDAQAPKFAAARNEFSTETGIKDALESGRDLFSRAMSPDELAVTMRGMGGAERDAFTQGARSAVADIMGSARNDAAAARGLFAKGWTREKLNTVLGEPATDALFTELEREGLFHDTAAGIIGNSRTAARLAAGKEFPSAIANPSISHGTTAIDAALYLPRKAANALAGNVMRDRAAKVGEDAAKALTATGSSRADIVTKLLEHQLKITKNEAQRAQLEKMIVAYGRSLTVNAGR